MHWIDEVNGRIKRKNQILFSKESLCLQELMLLIQEENHRVMVLWALDLAEKSVRSLNEKYPKEKRPEAALLAARDWASGKIKMRLAQRKILDCHAFAKEIDSKEDIASCHAIGQACGVVHAKGHAMGYPIYDLTSIVYKYGMDNCFEKIEERNKLYIEKLLYWRKQEAEYDGKWADFMLK